MSVIYKAIDRALQRTVAVKILRPSLTQDPSFLEKFRKEAQSVANLTHPNIVTVYDVGNDGPTHYIVMELIDGQDLKKIIKAHGAMPVERVIKLAIQICNGIGYAHRSGIVHADVKPQNMLVTSSDLVKVTDFGIAQALSDTQPQQRADIVWGSPHYFAPEQARGEPPSPAADVYAIGIVLFELLTGRLPYTGTNQQELAMAHIRDRIPMVTDFNPNVPDSLAKIVYKVMSKEPQGRYRTADQLGHVLQNYRERAQDKTLQQPQVPSLSPPLQDDRQGGVPGQPPRRSTAEPTARYSPAPNAPRPYNPRQEMQPPQQQAPRPGVSQPQPFKQNYANQVPAPPPVQSGVPLSESSRFYAANYSQPMRPAQEDEGGLDIVTIVLAILAFVAVGGLFPLFIAVLAARGG